MIKELDYASKLADVFCKSYNRKFQKQEDIRKTLNYPQINIKRQLIKDIEEHCDIDNIHHINVLCSNYGFNYIHDLLEYASVDCYDMDPYVTELSWSLFKQCDKKPNHIVQDIWLNQKMIRNSDLTIFPSCEHLPPIKYWEGFKQGIYVFSITNFSVIKDHNNIVDSIQEFEDQMPDMLDIIFSEEKEYEGYGKQFTIIGEM